MIFLNPFKMKWAQHNLSKFVCSLFLLFTFQPAFASVNKNTAKTTILPLVTFYSSLGEGEVYNWWAENNSQGDMKTLFIKWYQHLVHHPLSKWEYPSALQKDANIEWQMTGMTPEKKVEFAKARMAGLLIAGDVRIDPSPMMEQGVRWTQRLEVFRVKNGQSIGETLRIYDIPLHQYRQLLLNLENSKEFMLGTVADLHEKIETYKPEKPEMITKLVLTGELSGEQMQQIQERLRGALHSTERPQIVSYERNQVVFEVKGVNSEKLSQTLIEFHWKGYLTQVVSSDSSQVVFDVQSKTRVQ